MRQVQSRKTELVKPGGEDRVGFPEKSLSLVNMDSLNECTKKSAMRHMGCLLKGIQNTGFSVILCAAHGGRSPTHGISADPLCG